MNIQTSFKKIKKIKITDTSSNMTKHHLTAIPPNFCTLQDLKKNTICTTHPRPSKHPSRLFFVVLLLSDHGGGTAADHEKGVSCDDPSAENTMATLGGEGGRGGRGGGVTWDGNYKILLPQRIRWLNERKFGEGFEVCPINAFNLPTDKDRKHFSNFDQQAFLLRISNFWRWKLACPFWKSALS